MKILEGRSLAAQMQAQVAAQVERLKQQGVEPTLAVVLVGDDPASQVYVAAKHRACEQVGIRSLNVTLPASTSQAELEAKLRALNEDKSVHAILLQLPLPAQLEALPLLSLIDPNKDVDGFHPLNMGRLMVGQMGGLLPCTPQACLHLIHEVRTDLAGLHAVMVGCSNIVGKPTAQLLLQQGCTVSMAHKKTRDLPALVKQADILVVAAGHPELIKADWLKEGVIIIDVGINRLTSADGTTRLVGDTDFTTCQDVAGAITPVPGGVGPLTVAYLMRNVLACVERVGQ